MLRSQRGLRDFLKGPTVAPWWCLSFSLWACQPCDGLSRWELRYERRYDIIQLYDLKHSSLTLKNRKWQVCPPASLKHWAQVSPAAAEMNLNTLPRHKHTHRHTSLQQCYFFSYAHASPDEVLLKWSNCCKLPMPQSALHLNLEQKEGKPEWLHQTHRLQKQLLSATPLLAQAEEGIRAEHRY